MTAFGANILAQYLDNAQKAAVRAWIKNDLRPPEVVVMDDFNFARDIVQDTGGATRVIYRAWDRRDHEWHTFLSAEQIYERHRPYMQAGVYAQVWNEPHGYTPLQPIAEVVSKLCAWAAADVPRGTPSGIALPHWAVGHPDDARIDAGEFDAAFHAIANYRRVVRLCAHEYAISSTLLERPFRIGRIERSLLRAAAIGAPIPPENVSITEYGRDVGGGKEDGWQMVFEPGEYLVFLKGGMPLYNELGIACAHPFCIGNGADGDWTFFNIWGHSVITNGLARYNEEHDDMDNDAGALVAAVVTSAYEPEGSTVRQQPGTGFPLVGVLHKGDSIRISEGFTLSGNWQWRKVEKLDTSGNVTVRGWTADTGAFSWEELPPVEVPPDDEGDHDTHPNLPPTPELHPDSMSAETREVLYIVCSYMQREWAALADLVKPR